MSCIMSCAEIRKVFRPFIFMEDRALSAIFPVLLFMAGMI